MNEITPDPSASEASEAGLVAPADQVSSDAIDAGAAAPATVEPQRHAAMVAAANAIGSVPALDEVTRSRLVRSALSALDSAGPELDQLVAARARRRSPRWLVPVGSVAATAALVVGVVSLAGNSNDPLAPVAESSDPQIAAAETDVALRLTDLGEVSDPAMLRALVLGDAPEPTTMSAESFEDPQVEGQPGGPEESVEAPIPSGECLESIDPDLELALLGSATFDGEPAVVASGASATATVVYVIGADCTILSSLQVATGADQP